MSYKTHGLTCHKVYTVWCCLKSRCYNKNEKSYHDYGGRGIEVCKEWIKDFKSFYDWSMSNEWEEGLQIDRIDNDKGYEPSNCRFVSQLFNANNKREIQKNNTSGYRGVSWHKSTMKWQSRINTNGKEKHLGWFDCPKEAGEAYQEERKDKLEYLNGSKL